MTSTFPGIKLNLKYLKLFYTKVHGVSGYLYLPADRVLNFRFAKDHDEVAIWEVLGFCLTRAETLEERAERLDAEIEAEFMALERDRYTQWAY